MSQYNKQEHLRLQIVYVTNKIYGNLEGKILFKPPIMSVARDINNICIKILMKEKTLLSQLSTANLKIF